jgi:hypothetical protein
MALLTFQVGIPTDEGFIGRECKSPGCEKYFRVHIDSIRDESFCPYCGAQSCKADFITGDQLAFVRQAAAERAKAHVGSELTKMLQQATRGSRYLKFKPGTPYRPRPVTPQYSEWKVDSEIRCPRCSSRFQIDGIFAYCVGCGIENIAIYDANLAIIQTEIAHGTDSQRVLRHAYNDLVSTFEAICAKRARALTDTRGSFQDPYDARRFFKQHGAVDILSGFNADDLLLVRRLFHKRHAYQHSQGRITDRYVEKIPEDRGLLNKQAELSLAEFEAATKAVRRMVDTLLHGLETAQR